ncbi:MAG: hypothetical protein K2I64_03275 [Muribaculaceae bacterium]|nr:hypothetical protein [Muribaculaceae bacterium]
MMVPACLFFLFCAAAGVVSSAREVTVQPVADLSAAKGAPWDLSRFEPVGSEIDLRIAGGDSLTSVWLPDTRFDFVMSGDTAALACEETRVFRVVFTPASVESNASGEALSEPFTARGRMYQSEYISAAGASSVMPAERVTIISFSGDTIAGARLDRSSRTMRWCLSPDSTLTVSSLPDSMVMTTRIDRLRLTAPGESFPRAMKKVVTTSWLGQTVSADSSAWVLTSPVASPSRTRRHEIHGTPQPDGGDGLPFPGGDRPAVTVTTSPDGITVIPSCDSATAASGQLRVAVNDIVGRSYIDIYISAADQSEVDTSSLPRGEYLIQVLSGDTPVAAIKYIRQ